ncbi:hypothetical protein BH23PLA1_BH23PLA1_14030 [soil metagenome]
MDRIDATRNFESSSPFRTGRWMPKGLSLTLLDNTGIIIRAPIVYSNLGMYSMMITMDFPFGNRFRLRRVRQALSRRPRRGSIRLEPLEQRTLLSTLPEGFIETEVVSGLAYPTVMEITPDGRFFIAELWTGNIRVLENNELLPEPLVTLPVFRGGERGLIGLALDPHFEHNPYLYVHYTMAEEPVHNRVSRFLVEGNQVVPGSEQVLLDLDPLGDRLLHNGGGIQFGADGALYIGVGDNLQHAKAQSLDSFFGKVLRINPDGSIPPDNPFLGQTTDRYQSIWAIGLRNPFSMALQPGTGQIFINDVGEGSWEEVNLGFAGANYGWPETEGPTDDLRFTGPIHAYPHTGPLGGVAIVAGDFYHPETFQFPGEYEGKYFYADILHGIRILDLETLEATMFSQDSVPPIVNLKVGDDGSLYYLTLGNFDGRITEPNSGALHRIQYTGNSVPAISRQPTDAIVAVGAPATFEVVPTGAPPYTYQWQRNGQDIPEAVSATYILPETTLEDDGARFRVIVRNEHGEVFSHEARLTVLPFSAPTIHILSPSPEQRYVAGQTYSFSALAFAGDGISLNTDALTWRIHFHHDNHFHPFMPPTSGISAGSLTVPSIGETDANVWFRIHVRAVDEHGLVSETSRDLFPTTAQITVQTSPPGLRLNLDDRPMSTPLVFEGVAGVLRVLVAPETLEINGLTWVFDSWSHGGPIRQTIVTPERDSTFTAVYRIDAGHIGEGTGFAANYYASPDFTGPAVPRIDPTISFDWHEGPPIEGVGPDGFSVRWAALLLPQFSESYQFHALADEAIRVWIDGNLVIETWNDPVSEEIRSDSISLEAGRPTLIIVEYREDQGAALAQLRWSSFSTPRSIIPSRQLVPFFLPEEGPGLPPPNGEPGPPAPNPPQSPPVSTRFSTADYNGDGRADLAIFHSRSTEVPGAAHWYLEFSNGGSLSLAFGLADEDIPVPGDYDGDGITDLAVFRPSTAEWFLLRSSAGPLHMTFGLADEDIPVPGDYDGDGITDLAVFRPSTAEWFLLRTNEGPFRQAFGLGDEDRPMPMDYDGDGITDLAVFRPSTAEWFLLRSSAGPFHQTFGLADEDIPVPADYDGDGILDLAVYRPSTAEWFVLRSTEGPLRLEFGSPGEDRPMTLDYDGDGRDDLALYRPSTQEAFIMQSSTGLVVRRPIAEANLDDVAAVQVLDSGTNRHGPAHRPWWFWV